MPADGVLEDIHDGIKRFLAAEIAGGDHGLHAYDAVGVVGGVVEKFHRVGEFLVPVAQLVNRRGSRPVVTAAQELKQQLRPAPIDAPVGPDRFEPVVIQPGIVGVESGDPAVESLLDNSGIPLPDFPLGPVPVAVLRAFEDPD